MIDILICNLDLLCASFEAAKIQPQPLVFCKSFLHQIGADTLFCVIASET